MESDPAGLNAGPNTFVYSLDGPLDTFDPDGLGGCRVDYPDYPIPIGGGHTIAGLGGGHSGVLGYDQNGVTSYYEYGRYPTNGAGSIGVSLPQEDGNVRKVGVPNITLGKDGLPDDKSMQTLGRSLSKSAGDNTQAKFTCDASVDNKKIKDYAYSVANDKDRPKYSWIPFHQNTCQTFAAKSMAAGAPK